jgi:hypothetical protein
MEHTALRPYAAVGTALLGAALIAVIPAVAPTISAIHVQSPAVELTATADAFLDLANALDPSASTDGLIGVANNFDSFLDLFGNPTVNVADTLATDFIGYLDLGSSVNSIPGLLETLGTDVTTGINTLDFDLGNDLGILEIAFNTDVANLDTDLNTGFGLLDTDLGSVTNGLGTIDADFTALEANNASLFDGLESSLMTLLNPLNTIATDVGGGGVLAGELDSILTGINTLVILDS